MLRVMNIQIMVAAMLTLTATGLIAADSTVKSGDAYICTDGAKWVLGTSSVEKIIEFRNNGLLMTSFLNKESERNLVPAGTVSDEFFLTMNDAQTVSNGSNAWKLVSSNVHKLKQGEIQLDITVEYRGLQVTKHYVVYPKSSIIREWIDMRNAGSQSIKVSNPSFFNLGIKPGKLESVDFHWMSGGGFGIPDVSWKLDKEPMKANWSKKFDSYDPFPVVPGTWSAMDVDGVDTMMLLNGKQIWPESGWKYIPDGSVQAPFDVSLDVKAGDRLVMLVNMHKSVPCDRTRWNPTIAYDDGETHTAVEEFSSIQGKNGWYYQYVEDGQYKDLVYYPQFNQWRRPNSEKLDIPFIEVDNQHPAAGQDIARIWEAPKDGHIRVSGTIVLPQANTGLLNYFTTYNFRLGPSRYALWNAMLDRESGDGLFISWDYFGHWKSYFSADRNGTVSAKLIVAGHNQTLAPGESLATPEAVTGLFREDLDNAGNEFLQWQYRYMWEFTRDKWFPGIRMLGYWWKGTSWLDPTNTWVGAQGDIDSTTRKVFRVVDLIRYCGADVYHRDWGWWDKAGDWNGPDWRTINNYLDKSDIGLLLYAFMYTVDPNSKVATEHPDWMMPDRVTLDLSKPEVVDHIANELDSFYRKYGRFEWRNDSTPVAQRNGDDTPLLAQDKGFREFMRRFLTEHPDCATQLCNGGSNGGGWDYLRYTSTLQITEGGTGLHRNYYNSLIMPPDKVADMCDLWDPDKYDKAVWRGLLTISFDMTGDTWDPDKLEGIRELVDIYHYLHKHGVVGRWVKVYRPIVEGDDPVMYFQRMSRDNKRGIIIPKRLAEKPVTIKPKGLLAKAKYFVSLHEQGTAVERTGADLMKNGIRIEKMLPGELIYLNLPMHPGSKLDKEAPSAPSSVKKQVAENMGYPGVELNWKPGKDNNWISYYEIIRNGKSIDKVAKGTYYFDHSAGADLAAKYEVRTVDGAVNRSTGAPASGPSTVPSVIIDDNAFTYNGDWKHQKSLFPAYEGTISYSADNGASAQFEVVGKRFMVFTKLGDNCGKMAISIDGGTTELVDTYSADDIWGVCVYRKDLTPGKHLVSISVSGERNPRSKDTCVYIDGIQVK